jgi:IclR family acetate operon transcriptional repressor
MSEHGTSGETRRRATATGQNGATIAAVLDDDDAKGSQTVAAIERAADTLLYFIDRADSGVTEISRDLGMSKAAVHRILASLRSRNLITLNETTRRYSLGPNILVLGLTYMGRIEVQKLAVTQLRPLSDATSETSTLSLRTGMSRIYVDQATPAREVIMSVSIGVPYPLHAGSSSKAFLAFLPQDEVDRYLSTPLAKLTPATVVDGKRLRRELAEIRERGWAESESERQSGAASVAAPIFDHLGAPQAVISVCGPADRLRQSRDKAVVELQKVTRELSKQLGYVQL